MEKNVVRVRKEAFFSKGKWEMIILLSGQISEFEMCLFVCLDCNPFFPSWTKGSKHSPPIFPHRAYCYHWIPPPG